MTEAMAQDSSEDIQSNTDFLVAKIQGPIQDWINSVSQSDDQREIAHLLAIDEKERSRMVLEFIIFDLKAFDKHRALIREFDEEFQAVPMHFKAAELLKRRQSPLHRSYHYIPCMPREPNTISRHEDLMVSVKKFKKASDAILGFLNFVEQHIEKPLEIVTSIKQSAIKANNELKRLLSEIDFALTTAEYPGMEFWVTHGIDVKMLNGSEAVWDKEGRKWEIVALQHPIVRCQGTKWNKFMTTDCGGRNEMPDSDMEDTSFSVTVPCAAHFIYDRFTSAFQHFSSYFEDTGRIEHIKSSRRQFLEFRKAQRDMDIYFDGTITPVMGTLSAFPGLDDPRFNWRADHDRDGNRTFDHWADCIEKALHGLGFEEIEPRPVLVNQPVRMLEIEPDMPKYVPEW